MADKLKPEYIAKLRETLETFHSAIARLIAAEKNAYKAGSQAALEHASHEKPDLIYDAIGIGCQLIESGADHLSAFAKILAEPIEIIASWTCIRSMLESCAIASWLLDPRIDAQVRVRRLFAVRYEGMEKLLKFGRTANLSAGEINAQKARIDEVEQGALALGYPAVTNRAGNRIGIGETMPSATDII